MYIFPKIHSIFIRYWFDIKCRYDYVHCKNDNGNTQRYIIYYISTFLVIDLIDIENQTQNYTNDCLQNLKKKNKSIIINYRCVVHSNVTCRTMETVIMHKRNVSNSCWFQLDKMYFNCAAFAESNAKSSIPCANVFFDA